jgi:hypothetical protein
MSDLTSTQVVGAVTEGLVAGGFRLITEAEDQAGTQVRVFEDPHSVVAAAVYDSWKILSDRWSSAQGLLVELMSAHFARTEPKAWDGYLILLTTEDVVGEALAIDRVRRDTTRVRKIVATGDDLNTIGAVTDVLLPVLPLRLERISGSNERVLGRLVDLLEPFGVDRDLTSQVVNAFEHNRSPMEAIWFWRQSK